MTEAEWLACDDDDSMLEFLRRKASDRKLRLFAVACCRRIWLLLTNEQSRKTVEIAERYADHEATLTELNEAEEAARWNPSNRTAGEAQGTAGRYAAQAAEDTAHQRAWDAAKGRWNARSAAQRLAKDRERRRLRQRREIIPKKTGHRLTATDVEDVRTWAEYAWVVRDIFGNPFRPVAFSPAWRTDTAVTLARQMYDSRDFGAMPILADALQDAGCDNDDVLSHCRGDGPHVRGCWVVDLVLGKE